MAASSTTPLNRDIPPYLEGLPLDTIITFYTIGRENPPHAGHIALHTEALRLAEIMTRRGYKNVRCMFILGSGPSTGSTMQHPIPELLRSMDDPISFNTKATVLSEMLKKAGSRMPFIITEKIDEIEKLKKLATDMEQREGDQQVRFIRVASTKEDITDGKVSDNMTKLKYMEKALTYNKLNVHSEGYAIGIPPNNAVGVVLSATNIRKDAYESIRDNTEQIFTAKYTPLYGSEKTAQLIYREIKKCAKDKNWTPVQLTQYIYTNGKTVPVEIIPPQTTPEIIEDVVAFMHNGGGIDAFIEKYKHRYGIERATIFYKVISTKKEKELLKKKGSESGGGAESEGTKKPRTAKGKSNGNVGARTNGKSNGNGGAEKKGTKKPRTAKGKSNKEAEQKLGGRIKHNKKRKRKTKRVYFNY